MKGKYFQALLFVGFLPVLVLAGVYFWMKFTEPPPALPPTSQAVLETTTVSAVQSMVVSYASTLYANIKKTHDDIPNLTAHNKESDLTNFRVSHPGVQGLFMVSRTGKVLLNLPNSPVLADATYATSDEFNTIQDHFEKKPNDTYQFYTQRLGYPAFLFAQSVKGKSIAVAVFNLGSFFDAKDTKGGVYFILDPSSGRYFYHGTPSKLSETFNPNKEDWLTKVTTGLMAQQAGSSLLVGTSAIVYAPLGIGNLGLCYQIPYDSLIPPAPAPKPTPKPTVSDLPQLLQKWFYSPFGLAIIILWAWVFLLGSLFLSGILAPIRRASAVVLNAAQGKGSIPPEVLKRFGSDEVGQVVQAAAMLMQNLEQDKQQIEQEKEETLRQFRSQMDEKAKEAAAQVSSAQQAAQGAKSELAEKSQVLNDKLKELDALKGMSEGLRNQSEQSKTDNAQLKGQLAASEKAQGDALAKVQQAEGKLKDMEVRLLTAVSAASAIQVSSVRAAAIRTMADELKTTLGIIKGYVSSALGTVQGGISEKQQEFLGMVINRSARLEKFINDLLDIYQVEIESEDVKREDVNLGSEIEGLAFNFQAQAEVKTIKLRVDPKPNLPKVPIIRRRFNQLWNILYLQIIKDAPRGAVIPITVEAVGENVKVTVEDPGLNVNTESLPRLFDEFYDPKHTASPQLAGTGLKFALVKTILAGHGGGAVAEKSDPGTRLILTFPTKYKKPSEVAATAKAAAAAPAPPASPAPSAAPMFKGPAPAGARPIPASPSPGAMPLGAMKPPALGQVPGAAKPPGAGSGVMDSLIAGKVPSVSAVPQKPPMPGAPSMPPRPPAPGGIPPSPLAPPPLGLGPKPAAPSPGAPALGFKPPQPPPGAAGGIKPPTPAPGPGILESLLDKKIPIGGPAPSAAPPPVAPPAARPVTPPTAPPAKTPIPLGGPGFLDALLDKKPVPPPATPPTPAVPSAAPRPGVPPAAGIPVRPPQMPPLGAAPPVAPRPAGTPAAPPPMGSPRPPAVPVPTPGAPRSMVPPPVPLGPPGGPKVAPTSLKPTNPPGGILDLDNMDTVKTGEGPAKAATPPAPARPAGSPSGMPPGGLNANPPASKDMNKESDGELIE